MNLLVVGATGTLGRQIVRHALDQGYQVRAFVRNPRKAAFLKQWGAELVVGNLCDPETITPALEGIDSVIDAATARATDSLSIQTVDWDGKVNLIKAVAAAGIKRYLFFSILDAEKHRHVPLMDIKHCTEQYLAQLDLDYTVLRLCGFMQGLIGQYAIPILDEQTVWVSGENSPIAYMNTQDIARFAIRALEVDGTKKQILPVVGTKAWGAYEIINLCERLSQKDAKIARLSLEFLRLMRRISNFFQWGKNAADRLAFAEVIGSGSAIEADMAPTCELLGIEPQDITSLEDYLGEYFSRILKKLKEIDYEQSKNSKNKKRKKNNIKLPF